MLPGVREILEISNLLYYEALTVTGFLCMVYVTIRLGLFPKNGKRFLIISALPLIIFTAVSVFNPITNFLFNIDENNLYVRGIGVYFHWTMMYIYLISATAETVYVIKKEKNAFKRSEYMPLLYFIIAPTVAGILQMLFYGVTSTQVGITISLIFTYTLFQDNLILSDELTGVHNRHGLNKYLGNLFLRHSEANLTVFMMDLDRFKQINDLYGHKAGDLAIQNVADTLKNVREKAPCSMVICRYGGDEFLAVANDCSDAHAALIKDLISDGIEMQNKNSEIPYSLHLSIGYASGICHGPSDAEKLIHLADKDMYLQKKKYHASK